MSKNSEDSIKTEECGIVLGYWDQEKTPAIIRDLEKSVNSIENKCKKLLQELIYYQHYCEGKNNTNYSTALYSLQTTTENSKTSHLQSTSVPDVAFRKALIQCDEFEETFHTEFEKKLFSINEELLATSKKIGLNDKIILFPTNEYLKVLKEKATKIVEEYWSKVQNEFIKTYIKRTTKSDLALSKAAKDRLYLGISKITQNEWEFYKKLSKLSVHKKKYKNSFRKKTIFSHAAKSNLKYKKVRYKKDAKHSVSYYKNTNANNTLKHAKETASDLYSDDANKIKKPIHRLLKKDHKKSAKKTVIKIPISNSHSSHSTTSFKNKRSVASKEKIDSNIKLCDNEVDIEMICNNLVDAVSKARRLKESITGISNATLENKPALGIFGNKPIPFIPCSSTTKSFNVGMKLQQFISLKKYSKSASSKEKSRSIYSGSRKTNTGRTQENEVDIKNVKNDVLELECEILKTRSINSQYIVTTYPWSPRGKETTNSESNHNNINDKNINQNKLLDHEINCLEHKDTCISSHCTSGDRKYRSRYTKTMPKDIVGYHHKCTRQYANGEESNVKSESKTTYASGPNFTLSECHKTDFYGSKKQAICNKASGDNSFDSNCNKLKEEWSKIFSMLSNLYRNYDTLKETVKNDENQTYSQTAVKPLENEIDQALEKYKEFISYYSKFLELKHQLKSIKTACQTNSVKHNMSSSKYQKNLNFKIWTYSTFLKKTLRNVEALQDKIRQINNSTQ